VLAHQPAPSKSWGTEQEGAFADTHSLPLNGFTVLCDALCKVLFTFRSPYLYAVGPVRYLFICLLPLMRYTIPHEAAIPNSQTRSCPERAPRGTGQAGAGALTLVGVPFQATDPFLPPSTAVHPPNNVANNVLVSATHPPAFGGWSRLRAHSPLPTQSQLLSFPALDEML